VYFASSILTRYAGAIRTWRSTPILQYSPLRAAGFEDEDDDEDENEATCEIVEEAEG